MIRLDVFQHLFPEDYEHSVGVAFFMLYIIGEVEMLPSL